MDHIPQNTIRFPAVMLTDSRAVLSHNALHRSDDLLHHRRRHGRGVDDAVRMGAQVLDELLAGTREGKSFRILLVTRCEHPLRVRILTQEACELHIHTA